MQRVTVIFAALAAIALSLPAMAQQAVTLNVVTAGDQNMVDYVKDYLGPMFEKEHPGVTVRAVGTGPTISSRWRRAPRFRPTALSSASTGTRASMLQQSSRSSTRRAGASSLSM